MSTPTTARKTPGVHAAVVAILLALATGWLGVAVPAAQAATFTVTNGLAVGPGSLRQAVINANNNPGVDTINVAPSATPIRPLVSPQDLGPMLITESVQIIGPGSGLLTIDDRLRFKIPPERRIRVVQLPATSRGDC